MMNFMVYDFYLNKKSHEKNFEWCTIKEDMLKVKTEKNSNFNHSLKESSDMVECGPLLLQSSRGLGLSGKSSLRGGLGSPLC